AASSTASRPRAPTKLRARPAATSLSSPTWTGRRKPCRAPRAASPTAPGRRRADRLLLRRVLLRRRLRGRGRRRLHRHREALAVGRLDLVAHLDELHLRRVAQRQDVGLALGILHRHLHGRLVHGADLRDRLHLAPRDAAGLLAGLGAVERPAGGAAQYGLAALLELQREG